MGKCNADDVNYFSTVLKMNFDTGIVRSLGYRAKPLSFFTVYIILMMNWENARKTLIVWTPFNKLETIRCSRKFSIETVNMFARYNVKNPGNVVWGKSPKTTAYQLSRLAASLG
jgi:hypothetical protein